MDYKFSCDIKSIREILNLTQDELAKAIGVEQITISRNEHEKNVASSSLLEKVYSFAFSRGVLINLLKEMLWKEEINNTHQLLFHGAKEEIKGDIDVFLGRSSNDFGRGFYTGESYIQAVSFVSSYSQSSVYLLDFDHSMLTCKRYGVDLEWLLTIAYYRGSLSEYKSHPEVQRLIKEADNCDYIIAPIADNRMFRIINSFIDGEITDAQCMHCLSATNLGNQIVFKSQRSIDYLRIVERCYISEPEKEFYKELRTSDSKLGDDKVKLARIKYRGQGRYIDEILK